MDNVTTELIESIKDILDDHIRENDNCEEVLTPIKQKELADYTRGLKDAYEIIQEQYDYYASLKQLPNRYCKKCGSSVFVSDLPTYSYYCITCDENLYKFETTEDNNTNTEKGGE